MESRCFWLHSGMLIGEIEVRLFLVVLSGRKRGNVHKYQNGISQC